MSQHQIEDVVQDTWVELFRSIGDLREPGRVGAWLAKTMRRGCIRARRRHDREVLWDDWDRRAVADPAHDVEARVLEKERNDLLWRAVQQLPPRQRDVARAISAFESYAGVGDALAMPVGANGPTRGRALRRLRLQVDAAAVDTGVPTAS